MRNDIPETKFALGQFVQLKDKELRDRYDSEFTGVVGALVGAWQGTKQGYGIIMADGNMCDFREEELEPFNDYKEFENKARMLLIALTNHRVMIARQLNGYRFHLKL